MTAFHLLHAASMLGIGILMAAALPGCTFVPTEQVTAGAGTGQTARTTLTAPRRVTPTRTEGVATTFLHLTWTAVPGASAYEVHLGPDTNPPLIASVSTTSLLVRDLPECTIHYWRIVALNDEDAVSSVTWKFETRCPDGP